MRIALLGTRGIPASYGGFETFAEQLSTRLASRGHKVFVYCRNRLPQTEYRGVDLRYLPRSIAMRLTPSSPGGRAGSASRWL